MHRMSAWVLVIVVFGGFAGRGAHAAVVLTNADAGFSTDPSQINNPGGKTGQMPVQSPNQVALIRFAQSQLPTHSVATATLKISLQSVFVEGPVSVHLVTSNWTEATVTGATRPSIASTPLITRTVLKAGGAIAAFDITGAVNAWIANPASNFGIAIMGAASPRTYIVVRTKEGGAGATLTIPHLPNQVTVSPSGGDYSDPVIAAKNAYAGETWCVSPALPANPCIMTIKDGAYILRETLMIPAGVAVVGTGIGKARLIAGPAVATAVNLNGPSITDATIYSSQKGANQAIGLQVAGGAQVTRVEVFVEDALTSVALLAPQSTTGNQIVLTNVDFEVSGTKFARGVETMPASDETTGQ